MSRLLIWGAGDQGTVTLDCALAMKRYDRIDFLDIREKGTPGDCRLSYLQGGRCGIGGVPENL